MYEERSREVRNEGLGQSTKLWAACTKGCWMTKYNTYSICCKTQQWEDTRVNDKATGTIKKGKCDAPGKEHDLLEKAWVIAGAYPIQLSIKHNYGPTRWSRRTLPKL